MADKDGKGEKRPLESGEGQGAAKRQKPEDSLTPPEASSSSSSSSGSAPGDSALNGSAPKDPIEDSESNPSGPPPAPPQGASTSAWASHIASAIVGHLPPPTTVTAPAPNPDEETLLRRLAELDLPPNRIIGMFKRNEPLNIPAMDANRDTRASSSAPASASAASSSNDSKSLSVEADPTDLAQLFRVLHGITRATRGLPTYNDLHEKAGAFLDTISRLVRANDNVEEIPLEYVRRILRNKPWRSIPDSVDQAIYMAASGAVTERRYHARMQELEALRRGGYTPSSPGPGAGPRRRGPPPANASEHCRLWSRSQCPSPCRHGRIHDPDRGSEPTKDLTQVPPRAPPKAPAIACSIPSILRSPSASLLPVLACPPDRKSVV